MVTKYKRKVERKKQVVEAEPVKAAVETANGNGAAPSDHDALRRLFVSALTLRMLAERGPAHGGASTTLAEHGFTVGDEAIVAGATVELTPEDTIVAGTGNSAARIAKEVLGGVFVSPAAGANGTGASVAPESCLACDPFNLGTGLALAHRLEKKRNVVVVLCAPESAAADRWREAMKFAGIHKLPVIYVLKSYFSVEPGLEGFTPALEEVSFMTHDGGFPAIIVDGHDAVGVWRVAYESIHRARNGGGPTLIECDTRFVESGDPLARMEHYLRKRGFWDDAWRQEVSDQLKAETNAAIPA